MSSIYLGNDFLYISTFDELIKRITEVTKAGKYAFRGYKADKEVLPVVMRTKKTMAKEYNMLRDFEYYASNYYTSTNAIDFLSCAQHYGLPTRLLDFSYNPFIALYFAINRPLKEKQAYYMLCVNAEDNILVNDICINNGHTYKAGPAEKTIEVINYVEELFDNKYPLSIDELNPLYENSRNNESTFDFEDKVRSRKLLLIDPNRSNQRLLMQQGLFLLPYTTDEKRYIQLLKENSFTIAIPKSLRRELMDYLNKIGINTYRLMPDIASVCNEIKNTAEDDA